MKTLGTIGGLGPETTAEFYRMVIRRARIRYPEAYPCILIHSIPVPFSLERSIVRDGEGEERMLPLLREGVRRLEEAGADIITIPCNTVHMFHSELQQSVTVPILNILSETAKVCKLYGFETVGVLGTGKTLDMRLYQNALEEIGIRAVDPGVEDRRRLGELIYRILSGYTGQSERRELLRLSTELKFAGAQAIILGCTDLQHLIYSAGGPTSDPLETESIRDSAVLSDAGASPVPLIDSLEALAGAAVRDLGGKKE